MHRKSFHVDVALKMARRLPPGIVHNTCLSVSASPLFIPSTITDAVSVSASPLFIPSTTTDAVSACGQTVLQSQKVTPASNALARNIVAEDYKMRKIR